MSIASIRAEKKKWNELNRRAKSMPDDYKFVYKQMLKYIYKVATMDGSQINELISNILDLFAVGISQGKGVLEVTGEDVAAFCDALIEDYDQLDVYIANAIEKSMGDVINVSGSDFDKLVSKYGSDNLVRVYPYKSVARWALGISASSIVSPVEPNSKYDNCKYYLYKDSKIIKVVEGQWTEYNVDKMKRNKYLSGKDWFSLEDKRIN